MMNIGIDRGMTRKELQFPINQCFTNCTEAGNRSQRSRRRNRYLPVPAQLLLAVRQTSRMNRFSSRNTPLAFVRDGSGCDSRRTGLSPSLQHHDLGVADIAGTASHR